MRSARRVVAALVGVGLVAAACVKVPYTNRKQFSLIPNGVMNNLGASSYDEILAQSTVTKKGADVDKLRQVGRRISTAADQPDYAWQFNLLADDVVNAWCLPGGYIGFYSGILPVLRSEAGMGFVMGHEVGHALARHSSERMSQQLALAGGMTVLDIFISGSGKVTEEQRALILAGVGLGAEVGLSLPFSRTHEKEADVIGLMLMAESGYPPGESIAVWDRMEEVSGGSPPVFLSTHPTYQARQDNQKEWMPEARKRFKRNRLERDTRLILWQ